MKIILIDKDIEIRECLRSLFEYLGFDCVESGGEFREHEVDEFGQFDLIVADAQVPVTFLRELVRHCQRWVPGIPLIILGHAQAEVQANIVNQLPKPIELRELILAVQKISRPVVCGASY